MSLRLLAVDPSDSGANGKSVKKSVPTRRIAKGTLTPMTGSAVCHGLRY